ncbi:hypothetical protein ACIQM4_32055 [Streptomyces sp. NPDC091272]|uniref:hypothetical protein n=1 Tax=Streptomyces sp. NPDC091272 TaxID=3365981 RepID=UPI003804409A
MTAQPHTSSAPVAGIRTPAKPAWNNLFVEPDLPHQEQPTDDGYGAPEELPVTAAPRSRRISSR